MTDENKPKEPKDLLKSIYKKVKGIDKAQDFLAPLIIVTFIIQIAVFIKLMTMD